MSDQPNPAEQNLLTTAQVAKRHGLSAARIRAMAKQRGVTPQVDEPRMKLWTPDQADALAPGKPGRPRHQVEE